MPPTKPSTNSIALAGEFAVLSQLALRGYDANLTLGNTKGVDILVSDPESGEMYRLEVKTKYHKNGKAVVKSPFWGHSCGWMMSEKHETLIDPKLYYCFVNLLAGPHPSFQFFVVPSAVVAPYVRKQHLLWLKADPSHKDTKMRTFRLAVADDGYPLPTPPAAEYEDAWDFGG